MIEIGIPIPVNLFTGKSPKIYFTGNFKFFCQYFEKDIRYTQKNGYIITNKILSYVF